MSELYDLYRKVGNEKYGQKISEIAPYFSTIYPEFVDLRPSFCEVKIAIRKEILNHLGTIHAIAICNGAELVAGLMTDVSIPANRRWIPTGMSVQYLAKAKTDLKIVARGDDLDWSKVGDIVVPVEAFDTGDTKVFSAQITMNVR